MKYGDISNKVGQAVIINADLLFDIKKKGFGLRTELVQREFIRVMDHLYLMYDLNIYIACMNDYVELMERIEEKCDLFLIPYRYVVPIFTADELTRLVNLRPVIGYFYRENILKDVRMEDRKVFQVDSLYDVLHFIETSGGMA